MSRRLSNQKLIVSIPCWGRSYVDVFVKYTVPCLLTPNNLPHLLKAGCLVTVQIFSDVANHNVIDSLSLEKKLGKGFTLELLDIAQVKQSGMRPFEVMTACHEYSLQQAINDDCYVSFLCSDILISDGFYKLALEKIKEGYKAFINSACRVNGDIVKNIFNENSECLASFQNWLQPKNLSKVTAKYLHPNEKEMALPTLYLAEGWPGIISWWVEDSYEKHSFYFNPTVIKPLQGMSFNGATFDSSDLLNHFLDKWEEVYVVTDSSEAVIIDLAPESERPLGKKLMLPSPQQAAEQCAKFHIHPWQWKVFQCRLHYGKNDCVESKSDHEKDAYYANFIRHHEILKSTVTQSFDYQAHLEWHITEKMNIALPELVDYFAKVIENTKDRIVVLYGIGHLSEYVAANFKWAHASTFVSDSNTDKLLEWNSQNKPISAKPFSELLKFDPVVIIMSLNSADSIAEAIMPLCSDESLVLRVLQIDIYGLEGTNAAH